MELSSWLTLAFQGSLVKMLLAILAIMYLELPPSKYTNKVVTLWYRAPELLLEKKNYTGKVDV